MNLLVYLYYPIIVLALLWGAKVFKKREWNEEWFSVRQTKSLQGFCAILVMLHHCAQKTCAYWHSPAVIVPGLEPFVDTGYMFVGVFLFCSGYGLIKSIQSKPNYLKGFFRKRVLPVIAAYYFSSYIFLIVRYLMGERLDVKHLIYNIIGIQLGNPNAWYVIALPILYMIFYICYRFCKNQNHAFWLTCAGVILYVFLGTCCNHNRFWFQGQWWYNATHFFLFGLLFARYEKPLTENMKRHYIVYVVAAAVMFGLGIPITKWAQRVFSYYGENYHMNFIVLRRWATLLSQVLVSSGLIFLVFLLGLKIRIGNHFLAFMGTITLEFYLMHGLFVELFGYCFISDRPYWKSLYYIKNVALFVAVVFVLGLISALLLKQMLKVVRPKKK